MMHLWSSKSLLPAGRSLGRHSQSRLVGALKSERHPSIAPLSSDGAKRSRGFKTLHWGTPSGKDIKIEKKIAAYLASPASGSMIHRNCGLIYVPNVFGIWQTSKLMADAFASRGYPCLILDIFNGDPVPLKMPENFDLNGWIAHGSDGNNSHTAEQIDPIIIAGINYMKGLGLSKIGAAGYCFGAKYVVRNYNRGIQCAFLAHPSFVENSEFAEISGPLSIAAAVWTSTSQPTSVTRRRRFWGQQVKNIRLIFMALWSMVLLSELTRKIGYNDLLRSRRLIKPWFGSIITLGRVEKLLDVKPCWSQSIIQLHNGWNANILGSGF
uniref:Dienelactone hydrolase domain-containing protein n=1 Tax=Bionectria ochroleuca TaxID=29856 RepID=A0A8H7NMA9_BIOOC